MTDELKPGTYRDEQGNTRYWDGSQWLIPEPSPTPRRLPKFKRSLVVWLIGGALVLIAAVSIFTQVTNDDKEKRAETRFNTLSEIVKTFFPDAVKRCNADQGISAGEDFLTIDGNGQEDFTGADFVKTVCLVKESQMPPRVTSRWQSTNALQGVLEDEWEVLSGKATVKVSWSFHPDSGPSMSFKLESPFYEEFNYSKHADLLN
jgi:hypothetical protein